MTESKVVAVVGSSAGGVEALRVGLVEPLIDRGYRVAVTLTPTAAGWLEALDEVEELEKVTELPVRSAARLPGEASPHPRPDAFAVSPATSNLMAKLALGIADNQALTMLCENIATTPMVLFPRVNAAHARQPSWENHLALLRSAGVDLVYGDDFWPLREPRTASPSRPLPWGEILRRIDRHLAG